jgi:Phosphopantetheine attachment site
VGEVEMAIARVWEELLGLERVGRHDHFFELGGHSLLAVQLFDTMNRKLNIPLEVSAILTSPTVATLASTAQKPWSSSASIDTSVMAIGTMPLYADSDVTGG